MPTVLIAGGSGLIGSRLSALLTQKNYEVIHLSRSKRSSSKYPIYIWDVKQQTIDAEAIHKADYVINLAGAGIVGSRWTAARKRLIISSRTESTKLLWDTIQKADKKPKAYISASAIGFYGDTGEELVDETAEPGTGFLSESCVEWERSIEPIQASSIRTVLIRIGIVLSTQGGALEKMLIPFHFLLGTYFGNGRQWYSWIHIDDICGIFMHAIEQEAMEGVYNGVAPNPARNNELTMELGNALKRLAIYMPAPTFMLRLVMGEMADTILSSSRISARKVSTAGYKFGYPKLGAALSDLLKRKV